MSGKKKRAKKRAKREEKKSDFAMAQENWQNFSQWQHEAETSRDTNISGINQKYGAENQALRDILVGEEERKFDATMKDLDEGATGTQLTAFQKRYKGGKGRKGMSQEEYFTDRFGAFTPGDTGGPAGEEAAAAGAAGRVPIQPGADDEGKGYFGW